MGCNCLESLNLIHLLRFTLSFSWWKFLLRHENRTLSSGAIVCNFGYNVGLWHGYGDAMFSLCGTLYLYSSFLVILSTQSTLQHKSHSYRAAIYCVFSPITFIHYWKSCQRSFRVKWLAQGRISMRTSGSWDQTYSRPTFSRSPDSRCLYCPLLMTQIDHLSVISGNNLV